MGLDVRCVYNLTPSEDDENYDVYISTPKFDDVDHVTMFEFGAYKCESSCIFRAGAYSAYNRFRNSISTIALSVKAEEVWENPLKYKGKPFFEIINFTDCDGCFDYVIADKLLNDFTTHKDVILSKFKELEPRFVDTYNCFIAVLKDAVEKKGLVQYY